LTALPPRVDVLGTAISATSVDETVELILEPPPDGLRVAICTVHSVITARREPALRAALTSADIVTTDGVPLVWALRLNGVPEQQRVYGHTVFRETIERGIAKGTSHFFYGSTAETLRDLVANLTADHPSLEIAGVRSAPFRPLTDDELADDIDAITQASPDVLWVGLGMPKQELWMARASMQLNGISLVGVGAVFDWVGGGLKQAPEWMQGGGLEWLYRMYREPRRLWRRYLWNNPAYLALLASQLVRRKVRRSFEP
jgi:N-acetylglucosaminyldiphosphoundecaprenol N-acetyl-beta-D-mannosaminyltransferase